MFIRSLAKPGSPGRSFWDQTPSTTSNTTPNAKQIANVLKSFKRHYGTPDIRDFDLFADRYAKRGFRVAVPGLKVNALAPSLWSAEYAGLGLAPSRRGKSTEHMDSSSFHIPNPR